MLKINIFFTKFYNLNLFKFYMFNFINIDYIYLSSSNYYLYIQDLPSYKNIYLTFYFPVLKTIDTLQYGFFGLSKFINKKPLLKLTKKNKLMYNNINKSRLVVRISKSTLYEILDIFYTSHLKSFIKILSSPYSFLLLNKKNPFLIYKILFALKKVAGLKPLSPPIDFYNWNYSLQVILDLKLSFNLFYSINTTTSHNYKKKIKEKKKKNYFNFLLEKNEDQLIYN